MLKRAGLLFTLMMLALPAFANAWTISARVAAGSGNVQNLGVNLLPTPGYVSLANTVPTLDLTVVPAAGSSISSVLVDGVAATAVSPGVYRVNYASRSSHSITAYFAAAKYTVTSTQAANGAFTIQQTAPTTTAPTSGNLTNVPGGAKIKVVAVPTATCRVTKITVGTTDYLPTGTLDAGVPLTAADITVSADTTVTATYALVPVISVSTFAPTLPSVLLDTAGVTLTATAAGNDAAGATFDFVVKDAADAVIGSVSNDADGVWKTATLAAGTYTATATARGVNGAADSMTISFTVYNNITYASNVCTGCHSNSTPAVVTAWTSTKHAESSGHDSAKCFRCHNAKGYLYAQTNAYTGNASVIAAKAAYPTVAEFPQANDAPTPISCALCHTDSPHGGVLRPIASWDPNGNGRIDQYDVCTSCHVLMDNNFVKADHYHGSASGSSLKLGRIITDTHFDDPATAAGQGNENGTTVINKVEGYVVRMNSANPCADCHDLHKSEIQTATGEATIQQEWARSGHAGKILKVKENFVFANFSTNHVDAELTKTSERTAANIALVSGTYASDAVAQAWTHYDWDNSTGSGSDRKTCQKCHTATGAANYMTAPATYNPANNDFSHLSGWTTTNKTSPQNEVLYCWGCHKSATTGELHAPGAITADYKFQGAKPVFPDVGASNVCITCHVGQASGNSITDLTAAANPFTNVSFVNSHYMAAAGLMYVKIGYTNFVPPQTAVAGATGSAAISYGQSLTSDADMTVDKTGAAVIGKVTSTHRKLGTSAIIGDHGITADMGLDKGGACVTCHYPGGSHALEFEAVNYDAVCVKCHTAEGVTPLTNSNYKSAFIEPQAEVYEDAIALAQKVLKDNYNISFNPAAYPYFYDDTIGPTSAVKNWTRSNFLTTPLTAAEAEKLMGACFNINVLKREPAAYAHARTYARRLLYDTIDFLDNKTIDQSVGTTALASGMLRNGNPIYTKGAKAFNAADPGTGTYAVTDVYTGTSESMTYLLGWARSGTAAVAGSWNAWERP